jgi:phospholipid/cholesterol/gamma-HCH transport system ATP-binding protein
MTTETPKIRIRGLCKSFDAQIVLDRVDLDIPAHANLVLLGASGSGKSVLAKCLLGLIEPDDGSIEIDGRETIGLGARDRDRLQAMFGVLFQNGALFDSLPIWQNVSFALINGRRRAIGDPRQLAIRALADVGLDADAADLYPNELSGGMQKRVALARGIIGNPELLVLDSPTDGLDPIVTAYIDRLLIETFRRLGATGLTITQDVASARRLGNRAAFLFEGRIRWEGPMAALDQSGDGELAHFVRSAPAPNAPPEHGRENR